MKKTFLLLAFTLLLTIFTCACNSEKSVVLFNKHSFTPETITSNSNTNVFKPGDKINYLITLPKPVQSKLLLIQIVKVGGDKQERLGYELVWGKTVKIRDEQVYYYTNYIVLNQTGAYIMKVYSRDNPTKLLTSAYFYVRN